MVFIFKTHPFNMTFKEIKEMTFRQALVLIDHLNQVSIERHEAVKQILKGSKDLTATYDVARHLYG